MKYLNNYRNRRAPSVLNDALTFADELIDTMWGSYHTQLNVNEDDEKYSFEVDLPGFTKNDIKVDLKQNNLILTAKNDSRERNKTVTLPQDIDGDKISASLKNGVLNITIPKKVKGDCKRIKVT